MSRNLLTRYIWLIDILKRYGSLTREELSAKWKESPLFGGEELSRRTFYNYRQAIGELFNIDIEVNPRTYEYYLHEHDSHSASMTDWLLNSMTLNNVVSGSRDVAPQIFLEDIPSAREHLATVIDSMRARNPIRFDYHPYTRSTPSRDILLEPYFLKIFRQRWYVTGRNRLDKKIKTYALDRMSGVTTLNEKFDIPADFDAETYSRDSFGIIFSQGEPKDVKIRTDARQAKYFRALPLHASQQEWIHDDFSIFTYRLRLTPDFVSELLSYGPRVTVISPPELRAMMVNELQAALDSYDMQSGKQK